MASSCQNAVLRGEKQWDYWAYHWNRLRDCGRRYGHRHRHGCIGTFFQFFLDLIPFDDVVRRLEQFIRLTFKQRETDTNLLAGDHRRNFLCNNHCVGLVNSHIHNSAPLHLKA